MSANPQPEPDVKVPGGIDPDKVEREEQALLVLAKKVTIETPEEYEDVERQIISATQREEQIKELFEEPVSNANKVHKFLTGLRARLLAPILECKAILDRAAKDWRIAEDARIAKAQLEQEAALQKDLEAKRDAEGEELFNSGQEEAGLAHIAEPVYAPIVTMPKPKVEGRSYRKVYGFRIVDASKINPEYLMADEVKIRKQVNATGLDAAKLIGPGIQIFEDLQSATRRH